MIFESLWPLALLAAVPVVIILYLLKPRGKDRRVSSLLLWEQLFHNLQAKTFLEKFIHNILMYLQIGILLLMMLALMSPYFHGQGRNQGSVILVLDTSGSMQHDAGSGRSRLEEALGQAKGLIADSEGTAFSILTNDCMGTNLLAVGVKDKNSLYAALDQVKCSDGDGRLQDAESVVETLRGASEEAGEPSKTEVIVFTDGIGAKEAESFSSYFDAQVIALGEAVDNVAVNFLAYTDAEREGFSGKSSSAGLPAEQGMGLLSGEAQAGQGAESAPENIGQESAGFSAEDAGPGQDGGAASEGAPGAGDAGQNPLSDGERRGICAASLTNYSDAEASLEISLYEGRKLLEIRSLTLGAEETALCLFQEFSWQGDPLRCEASSIRFAGSQAGDSLAEDNIAYALPEQASQIRAVLLGEGNTYLEKACQAATGSSLTRVREESALPEEEDAVRIYDAGWGEDSPAQEGGLIFGAGLGETGTEERVLLTVTECDLTAGLSAFSIGVNETKIYEIPEWATGFLWAGEKCAGYYGEHDGIKTVAVGFDIRESDFPLQAEFPVFIANALRFLSDTSLLAGNVYQPGDTVLFHPQADFDVNTLEADTKKAGLYLAGQGETTEPYIVRFAAGSQSDGRITAESASAGLSGGEGLVKRRLRNLLLALILILLAAEWVLYVRQTGSRSRFYFGVRAAVVLLLILALTGFSINKRDGSNTTIFLADISNSNEQNLQEMEEYLGRVIGQMPGDNRYGIVTFGKNSLVEQFLTDERRFSHIMSLPDKSATNFEEAVSRALAMIPADGAGRIVILTDGKETRGSLAATASALASRQIELLGLVYDVTQGPDAYVENVELPSYLYQNDAYSMTVTVESNYETDAQIQIWMGTMQTESYDVRLNRGVNRFRFRQEVQGENIESFEVRVVAAGDTCEENNSYHAYSVVDSLPRTLLISGLGEDSARFEDVLQSAGANYNRVSAVNAPDSLEELLEYKSVILENVYLPDLPEGFLESIETYVKDYGCGLICCGGDDSFALGAYRDTVLETVLPVDMELRGVDEIPKMAMIMVIDHSGSMGQNTGGEATSLDLAVAAAKTAVDQMRSTDYVGVLTFDDKYSWVVEPTLVTDRKALKEKIESIPEGGGTTIKPALWEALRGVEDCDVSIRHVVLLTDGEGEDRNFNDVADAYVESSVTLSTVAVGEGSDTALLRRIAEKCGGRYYYSDMASDIPRIFAQEVFLSGDTYLQNGEFRLAVSGSSEITGGLFETGWPMLYGYVSATPKSASSVLIASEKEDPVLTVMQYGLGHTVAWNTDVTNQWTAGFAGREDYVQLWKRLLDYSAGSHSIGEDSADVTTAGGYTNIVYHALDYDERTKVEAVYTDPEGNTSTVPLQASAPGRFETRLDTDLTGLYQLSVRRVDGQDITNAVTTAAAVQYSDEYKFGVGNSAFTGFVSRYGRLLEPEENFWKQRRSETRERYELTKWLILAAALLFLADIAFRRLSFQPQNTGLCRRLRQGCKGLKARRRGKNSDDGTEPSRRGRASAPADSETEAGLLGDGSDGGAGEKSGDRRTEGRSASSGDSRIGVEPKNRTGGKPSGKSRRKPQEQESLDTSALLRKRDQWKQ
ncbi:MAG: VWA domain-containing protein [Roseburia sp.]|nr:VWA domain-containing protein [Roseburia sp.]MCM1097333.1 VWA domain-containing protein [Ruminococcus flavefaciens]